MQKQNCLVVEYTCYDNQLDALVPEKWANEGLAILTENMVMSNLVHRDFNDEVADYGDTVNTRKPGEFSIRRKTDADNVEVQDAISNNVQVKLDQHAHVSFVIKDGEATRAFKELVGMYLEPAMLANARAIDRSLLGRAYAFNSVGRLGGLDVTNGQQYVTEARKKLNDQKAHMSGRNLILSSSSESALLNNPQFTKANERGDGGTALEEARLGRILGFDTWMSQNVSDVSDEVEVAVGATAAAEARGTTGPLGVSVVGYEAKPGEFVTIAGDDQMTYATATVTGAGDTTAIELNQKLKYGVAAGADVKVYKAHMAKGAYGAGWSKGIVLDGNVETAQIGQLFATGSGLTRKVYTIIEVDLGVGEYTVHLDRPLENPIADDEFVFPGPEGAVNLAFHRNALALVSRPLALPMIGSGVNAAVINAGGVSMRVTMQYQGMMQGTLVTLDMLYGTAVLEDQLAVTMLG